MELDKIYKIIFPLGGIDDNNRYIELTGNQINTVQLVEPAVAVSEFRLTKQDRYDKNNQPDKYACNIPLVMIDSLRINQINITAFNLDYTGFLPTVMVEFADMSNSMLSTNVVKDGSIIKVYVGGNGDELYYKPIRQDFVLTSIKKVGGGDQNNGGYLKYRAYGKLNIPYGYRKESWSEGKCTSMQSLFNICVYTGLGFATNFTRQMVDCMDWQNEENCTYFDFIEDITSHACYSPNTFFTSFIDQYNVLNFVECHSLLSHGGKKTDTPAMIYVSYPPAELPDYDPDSEKTTQNQLPLMDGEDPLNNRFQKMSYYFLSNNEYFSGWTNFIEEYVELNNGHSSLSSGYGRHIIYDDSNRGKWGFGQSEFFIRPIDNLKRDSRTQKIERMPEEPTQETYVPLNLMHMNKSEYSEEGITGVDDMTNVESFTNYGRVDTSNMFKQYYFAEVQNEYQMKCMKKCGLKITLQNYNPSITKFSRVWVDIYDKNMMSNSEITKKDATRQNDSVEYRELLKTINDNIMKFDDEGVIEDISDTEKRNKNWPRGEFNRSLSGWYVITEMSIYYSPKENNLKMDLILNRIEHQPCFKDECEIARKAVDKYRDENNAEDLINEK